MTHSGYSVWGSWGPCYKSYRWSSRSLPAFSSTTSLSYLFRLLFYPSLVIAVKTVLTAVYSPESFLVSHGCHSTRVPRSLLGHENLPENRSASESHLCLQITHLRNQVEAQKDTYLFVLRNYGKSTQLLLEGMPEPNAVPFLSISWSSVAFAVLC